MAFGMNRNIQLHNIQNLDDVSRNQTGNVCPTEEMVLHQAAEVTDLKNELLAWLFSIAQTTISAAHNN